MQKSVRLEGKPAYMNVRDASQCTSSFSTGDYSVRVPRALMHGQLTSSGVIH